MKDHENMFFVYVISSEAKDYVYVGLTADFDRRLKEHNSGKNKTTRPYRPFKVLLVEEFRTRVEARRRERYLKSGSGREWVRKTIFKN